MKLPLADKKRQARESPIYKSDRYLFPDFESREVSHPCFKKTIRPLFSFLVECQYIICWYCNRSEHRLFLDPCRNIWTAFGEEGKIPGTKLSLWQQKNGESFWVKLKLETIILSRHVVITLIIKFLTASVIHATVYQQRVEIVDGLSKKKTAIANYSAIIRCRYIWEGLRYLSPS